MSFRPEVEIVGTNTRVLAKRAAAVDQGRLGNSVGFLNFDEMRRVDSARTSSSISEPGAVVTSRTLHGGVASFAK